MKYSASNISSDVVQRSFSKCTAKQMSFESGFKCGVCFSTSDLFWKLVPAAGGIIAKSGLLVFLTDSILMI